MTTVVEIDFIYYDLGVLNQLDFPGSQGIDQPFKDKHRYEPWNVVYIECHL